MAENSHAVRPGEHEIQPALHCCYRVPAPALGRELRMDAVEASAMRHENKPSVLRPQSEVSLVGKGRGRVEIAFAAKTGPTSGRLQMRLKNAASKVRSIMV
jgi:hypothetical protein